MRTGRIIGSVGAVALILGLAPSLDATSGALPVRSAPAAGASRSLAVDDSVHLNEIQVIGSHNSYHLVPPDAEVALRESVIGAANDQMMYEHASLPVQFQSQKVRQIELDIFLDPAGGKYAKPLIRGAAGIGDYDPAMDQPGIKVLHVQDVDYHSSCLALVDCLSQVKGWSDANPTHAPIAILLELKDDPLVVGDFEFTTPDPWTASAMQDLDAEIREVFPADQLITPDDVRGAASTLEEAVTTTGWPTLGESRGKVMFMMDNGGADRTDYLTGTPNLEGRPIFTNANPGDPDAAFVKRNDPTDASIPGLVEAGYVVRTRADGDTTEARANDTSKRDAALASGAQWVSTDYPIPGIAVGFTTSYVAAIPGGTVARCNPVNAPAACVSAALDTIYTPIVTPVTPTSTTTTSTPTDAVDPAGGAQPVDGQAGYTG